MNILVFNAGSASLKIEVIEAESTITTSDRGRKLVSVIIEGIVETPRAKAAPCATDHDKKSRGDRQKTEIFVKEIKH